MQAQTQQLEAAQQQIAQAQAQAKVALDQAKASDSNARAQLALAQAYKAIADARARTADVEGKNDERQFSSVMDALDQHNTLAHEDRTHELAVDQQTHGQAKETVDQFADLANTERDFRLKEQVQREQRAAVAQNSGESE
jgi:hypothetical protein